MKSSEDPSLQDREVRTPPSPLPARQRGPAGLEPHREGEDTVLLSVGYHLFNSGDTSSISLTLVPCGSWYHPILLTGHHYQLDTSIIYKYQFTVRYCLYNNRRHLHHLDTNTSKIPVPFQCSLQFIPPFLLPCRDILVHQLYTYQYNSFRFQYMLTPSF